MAQIYYVYQHRRTDTNEIFYVGKGKENRCYSKKNRNKHWHNITNKTDYCVEVVVKDIDEEFAYLLEQELIAKHKYNNAPLVNYTDGGEGFSGGKHSYETKLKMSLDRKGKTSSWKGMLASDETKLKMSLAKLGKKPPNVGMKWWNNGVINKISIACPGDGWVNGQLRK